MDKQILFDKLSEFLIVEQGGAQLYKVVAERATNSELKQLYQKFGAETMQHRDVLLNLIQKLGGDPSYVSATARIAQHKGEALLNCALLAGPLTQEEMEMVDLENVLIAETKDYSDWALLDTLSQQMEDGEMKTALREAVDEVFHDEDEHVRTIGQQLSLMQMQMAMNATSPEVRPFILNEKLDIKLLHPKPVTKGLLDMANESPYLDSTPVRAAAMEA